MRFRIGRDRSAANKRYNDAHPGHQAARRLLKRQRSGKAPKATGRPKKKVPNFSNYSLRNRNTVRDRVVDFVLIEDDANWLFKLQTSNIDGLGIFCVSAVAEDDCLMHYLGDSISQEEADVREQSYQAEDRDIYLFSTDGGRVIDSTKRGNLARFINHSCQPNCITECDEDDNICIFALRNLAAGEEVTIDYRLTDGETIVCKCQSTNCVGHL